MNKNNQHALTAVLPTGLAFRALYVLVIIFCINGDPIYRQKRKSRIPLF